jgi:hypothetical protein
MLGKRLQKANQIARKRMKRERSLDPWFPEDDDKHLGIMRKTGKRCSCPMCGNPRKHFGLKTLQEIKDESLWRNWNI